MSDVSRRRREGFRPRLIALSAAACFGVSAQQALANPAGGAVVSGGASFASSGNTLTVTNTANAIINWQSFSIGVNEITRFLQSSASSAVLNRVVGASGVIPQSVIDGVLSSNGRVFLLNASGIVFGANAHIDVAGFVASSLNLSDQDFLNGRMHFTEVPGAGGISNAGIIQAASGGRVFLVAPSVENSGVISAPQGQIVLAAGKSVDLVSENSPFVTVRVTADSEQALNLGQLIAESGRIDMSGALVRQSGVASANSASLGASGEIRLVATNRVTLDAGSVTSASGGTQGGNIQVSAPVVVQVGELRADGDAGGRIQVDAGNFLQAGTVSASGSAGAGGEIGIHAAHVIQTTAAVIAADGNGGDGGSIGVDASGAIDGLLFSSARYSATGDKGGSIKLFGHDIVLLGASADASGTNGGGTILVGGDFQGNNPAVPNAATTGINFSTTLKADATQTGDGGRIVVWSDMYTQFYGTASARGGAQSGNGGFMEISGRENLTMGGFADAGSANGTPGTLLLDPKNIIIDSNAGGGTGTLGSFQLVDPHPGANENFGTQVVVLPSQNVVVTDPNDSFVQSGAGAVYLFDSTSGALISTLTGGAANDRVGSGGIVQLFITGNYLITSPSWTNGGAGTSVGAVTWGSGTAGVSGTVSSTNSLVGSITDDQVGLGGITELNNGNYVVSSYAWANAAAAAAGAVTFGNGTTGVSGAVSATNSLVGTTAGDLVGIKVTGLSNGNYVVSEIFWQNSGATRSGAVTWVDGTNGNIAGSASRGGAVSAANSLVGSAAFDDVGTTITELFNGNYVMSSPFWGGNRGAVTWLNGTNGNIAGTASPGGLVSALNSLVGNPTDQVGHSVTALLNGNYVVESGLWHSGSAQVGAVTWVNGLNGNFGGGTTPGGLVSTSNSLVGSQAGDTVGFSLFGLPGIVRLPSDNYLVISANWANGAATLAGAVTLVNGSNGNIVGTGTPGGAVSAANSLVGTTASDRVGSNGVMLVGTGNYVVISPNWDIPAGASAATVNVGAVTFGSSTAGVFGAITSANSLIGATANDAVGSNGVTPLSNGNYVVNSPSWNNGAATLAGAVTFGNGTTGVAGTVSAANSLVGSTANDQVGNFGITPLFVNGNYVVNSPNWNNGTTAAAVGAVTFGNGATGIAGAVSATNSLVGSTADDQVGNGGVMPLFNGNYVVTSQNWNNGPATSAGAVTFGNGTTGIAGAVSATNSLVGTTANDFVGIGGVTPLFFTGNYVVSSPFWNGGVGAVTFASGTGGTTGPVTPSNSLVGSTPDNPNLSIVGDRVGSGDIVQLLGGNYLVASPEWNNTGATRAGAVTWVNGTNGNVFGQASPGAVVSASNSLVGGTTNDQVGLSNCDCSGLHGIDPLPNGNFVVVNTDWTNPVTGASRAGAVTFGSGTTGIAGLVSSTNSLIGSAVNDSFGSGGIFPLANGNFVVSSPEATNPNGTLPFAGLVHVGTIGTGGAAALATGQTFASNPGGDVTITPASITAITNTGTALVLQANNDITLKAGSDIVTSTSGAGGALTLQAGRSILLNSSISTDDGNLTLIANDPLADGANRDAGAALIAMTGATVLNAGSGAISITLADGAGRAGAQTSGDITLASVATSGSLSIRNNGLTAGSDVLAGGTLKAVAATLSAATGALGSATAPLEIAATDLNANASNGIYLNTNSASPTMVTVSALANGSAGDIVMNAHGGATFISPVSNPGGNVSITTFSPLDVNAGISAGNSIFLTTSGAPGTNDMSLAGPFTYGASGTFQVTIGPRGHLTFPPLVLLTSEPSPNPTNITKFIFVPSDPDPSFAQGIVNSAHQSTKFDSDKESGGGEKKDNDTKKKGLAACKGA